MSAYLKLGLIKRQILPLDRNSMPDQLSSHVSLDDVTLPHIAHSEHKARNAVPVAYDGVSGKEQRLRPLLRPGQFGEHHSHHERLDHHAEYALETEQEYRFGTFFRRSATSVSYRMLRFDAEEKAGGEAVDVGEARRPGLVALRKNYQ